MDAQDFALQVLEDLQGLRADLEAHRAELGQLQQTATLLEQALQAALEQGTIAQQAATAALHQNNQLLAILIQTLRPEPGPGPPPPGTGAFVDDFVNGIFGSTNLAPPRGRRRRRGP